jgi:aminoglycoside phosphotransferase (APT) family kinase protein
MVRPTIHRTSDDSLNSFRWSDIVPAFEKDLEERTALRPLVRGREAELFTLGESPRYVVKVWPAGAADAGRQWRLLKGLATTLPVAEPAAWGIDADGRQALATAYAGRRIEEADSREIETLAGILAAIHATPFHGDLPVDRSHLDMMDRLGLAGQGDLERQAQRLMSGLPPFEQTLTHGDFHLGNVTARGGRYTVVDWSNARLADWRVDLAWALLLLAVYYPVGQDEEFLAAYLRRSRRKPEGIDGFAALAALHWIALARTAPVPINREWEERANRFLAARL